MSRPATSAGRHAHSPSDMPAKGWKAVLMRVKDRFEEHRVTLVAAGITFYILLALFPAIASLVAVYGLVADPETIRSQLATLQGIVPASVLDIVRSQVERLASQSSSSLSLAFAGSLFLSLYSSTKGVKALFKAMNIAYEEKDERSFIRKNVLSLVFVIASIVLVVLALLTIVVIPSVISFLPIPADLAWIVTVVPPIVLAAIAVAWVAGLFRLGPDRRSATLKWLTPGALFTIVGWVLASAAFSFYAANVKNFDAAYGSMASIIVFLMWTWIMMIVLLAGAEINAQLEHQTGEDTTVGEDRAPGDRDATLADHIAALKGRE
ncbi:YihY/virulence factor BrkB family protein [Fulvimarina sp. 2208YS6-2-32]|uniref:YihY/virulence factor BrkB family protein n=1 Tax=Fulvimarina uroteuthidis TaxID=3098149 RepID=A0ABU5I1E5_9HYPH|nr:YihY/virulence factor BrkB family protein [Fulvimarina sp. 2208YS6-2-32]MDY8109200.1 YihY/virulence factor BrkB family protein [Fulvimarina sp. 2208YS6-2-32]